MHDPKRQYSTVLMRAPFSGDGHTSVANSMVRDRRLSFKARGILTFLGSHIEGWQTSEERLAEESPDKLTAIRSGLAELEEDGYMLRFREILANGTRAGALWIFSDNPAILHSHTERVLAQLAAEGRRFMPLSKRTRESMKRRRRATTTENHDRRPEEPGSENHNLDGSEENRRSEPTSEKPNLDPAWGSPSLDNPMPKNTNHEGKGEEGFARARETAAPSPDDEPQWGVAGGRRSARPTLADADVITDLAREVLAEGEYLTAEEHQELAGQVRAVRSVVEAQPGLSWAEYEAWLGQGWLRPDGSAAYKMFSRALSWRLRPEQVKDRAWAWACQRRGAREESEARGTRKAPESRRVHEQTCSRHDTTLLDGARCVVCDDEERETEARRREAEEAAAATEDYVEYTDDDVAEIGVDPVMQEQMMRELQERDEKSAAAKEEAMKKLREKFASN